MAPIVVPPATPLRPWQGGVVVLGAAIVAFVAAGVILPSVAFLVGGSVSPVTTVPALLLGLAVVIWPRANATLRGRAGFAALFVAAVALSIVAAAATVDLTWDGNAYHKLAIGELRAGWNPVYASAEDFNASPAASPYLEPKADSWIWVDNYPKASWIFGASIAQVTGLIETSKAFGILLALALGLIALGYLSARLGTARGVTLAVLLALNPITVTQIFTNYVDGSLSTLLLIALVILTMNLDPGWAPPRWWRILQWPTLGAALVLLANLKFTGLLYAGIVGVVYLLALGARWRTDRGPVVRLALTGAVSVIVAVGIVGASSYVRNWIVDGHPLAPLFGPDATDVLEIGGEPDYVAGRDRVSAFLLANLSRSSLDGTSGLKVPFTFTLDELGQFDWVDIRIGGYGVLFGGLLLVSVVLAVVAALRARGRAIPYLPLFLAPLVVIVLNVVLVDGSWWARYVPELCVVPLLAVVAFWGAGGGRLVRAIGWLVLAVTAANSLAILAAQTRQQVIEWPHPPLAEQVEAGGCGAVYPSPVFSGLAFNAVDLVPGVRILTPAEFERIGADGFREATSRVFLLHPLLIQTRC